jgi:hypothetical protein
MLDSRTGRLSGYGRGLGIDPGAGGANAALREGGGVLDPAGDVRDKTAGPQQRAPALGVLPTRFRRTRSPSRNGRQQKLLGCRKKLHTHVLTRQKLFA